MKNKKTEIPRTLAQRADEALEEMCGGEDRDTRFAAARLKLGMARGVAAQMPPELAKTLHGFLDSKENDSREFSTLVSGIFEAWGRDQAV